jgi:hypothetical protein
MSSTIQSVEKGHSTAILASALKRFLDLEDVYRHSMASEFWYDQQVLAEWSEYLDALIIAHRELRDPLLSAFQEMSGSDSVQQEWKAQAASWDVVRSKLRLASDLLKRERGSNRVAVTPMMVCSIIASAQSRLDLIHYLVKSRYDALLPIVASSQGTFVASLSEDRHKQQIEKRLGELASKLIAVDHMDFGNEGEIDNERCRASRKFYLYFAFARFVDPQLAKKHLTEYLETHNKVLGRMAQGTAYHYSTYRRSREGEAMLTAADSADKFPEAVGSGL